MPYKAKEINIKKPLNGNGYVMSLSTGYGSSKKLVDNKKEVIEQIKKHLE